MRVDGGYTTYGQWRHPLSQQNPRSACVRAVITKKPETGSTYPA